LVMGGLREVWGFDPVAPSRPDWFQPHTA